MGKDGETKWKKTGLASSKGWGQYAGRGVAVDD